MNLFHHKSSLLKKMTLKIETIGALDNTLRSDDVQEFAAIFASTFDEERKEFRNSLAPQRFVSLVEKIFEFSKEIEAKIEPN